MKVFKSELSFSRVIETVANPERYLLRETNLPIALAPLVGKGPGLTPLGDDFIIGVAAGIGDTSGIAMAYGCLVGFQVGKNIDQKTGADKSGCSIRRPIPNYSPDNQAA